MKNNQKGFSIAEILIVVVVVGLLGAVGWLVYDRQKNKVDNKQSKSLISQKEQRAMPKQETKTTVSYDGWKTYSKDGYEFKYPSTWKIGQSGETGAVVVNSPDLSIKVVSGPNEIKGAQFSISKTVSSPTMKEDILSNKNGIYSDVKNVIVNSKEALRYKINQSFEDKGPEITTVFDGNNVYEISYSGPESVDYQKYLPDYQKLVDSFRF